MEAESNATREYARELLWAAFMFNLIMGLVGLLMGAQLGSVRLGLALFLGGGLLITAVLALVVLGNAAVVWLIDRRHSRKQLERSALVRTADEWLAPARPAAAPETPPVAVSSKVEGP